VRTETLIVLSSVKETGQLATEPPAWASPAAAGLANPPYS